MRLPLQVHPDSICEALDSLAATVVRRSPRKILVRFDLEGRIRHLNFPWIAVPTQRLDGLWQTTCFEIFLRAGRQDAYVEYNLSPRTHWNIYHFQRYRSGMEEAHDGLDPHIAADQTSERAAYIEAVIDLSRMAWLPTSEPWHLGLNAVIEERSGRKSYWALKHPDGPPDFHHDDCFALELAAARPA